jgi:hypothetical protein
MKTQEITIYGMLDNVKFSAPDEMHATLCELSMVDSDGMGTFPDRDRMYLRRPLSITFTWDATPTDMGQQDVDAHVSGMEPADVPDWMRDGSYVEVKGVVYGDSITARVITYQVANGLSCSATSKA